MIAASVGLLLPVIALWTWIDGLPRGTSSRERAVLVALAFGCGVGASSITTMGLVLSGVPIGPPFVIVDAVLWGTIAAIGLWRLRASHRARRASPQPSSCARSRRIQWPVRLVFIVVAAMAAATAVQEYLLSPHGEWDAWAIWNQKARFLVRGGERWTDELSIIWSNPSHPLLLPLTVARIWAYAGVEATGVPAAIAAFFGAGCVAIVMGVLGLHRRRAWIAGAVLVAPGAFLQETMTQQADVPLAFFMVSAVVMLLKADTALAIDPPAARGCLVLAGVLTGCAAWTKNEGVLFAGAMAPALLWVTVWRRAPRQVLWSLLGAALPLLTLVWFKINVAPVPPLYFEETQAPLSILARVASSDRGGSILQGMAQEARLWGGPGAAGVAILMLAASMVAAIRSSGAAIVLSVIASMVLGYYSAFAITPLDAAWLVKTTFYRLVAQLWPLLVLAAFWNPLSGASVPMNTDSGECP